MAYSLPVVPRVVWRQKNPKGGFWMKKVILLSLGAVGLVVLLLVVGCLPGAQFGAPGVTGIRGKVAMPGNNCYTLSCASPQVSEGNVPAPQAKVRLEGEGGQVLETQTDDCGNYEVSGASDSCYVLYADVPGGTARVKKGIIVESGKTNDAGEANYYTTAQVIIYETIRKMYPEAAIKCSDIPEIKPPQDFVDAVRMALAGCRDAQTDRQVMKLAAQIVSNCFGASTCTTWTITPRPCRPGDEPKADFEIKEIEGVDGGWKVTFKNTSTGRGNRYTWDFGDGTTSAEENPVHTYPYGRATYNVTLTAENRCGKNSITQDVNLASVCPSGYTISASIEDPESIETGASVVFQAQVTQAPLSYPVTYTWFVDDTQVTDGDGDDSKLTHTFTAPGNYTVKVQAVTDCGSNTAEVTVTVSGCPVNYSITASLLADKTSGDAPLTVNFTASYDDGGWNYPVTYNWDLDNDGEFDDGTGDTLTHTFTAPGNYTVKVKAATECGEDVETVTITANCKELSVTDFDVQANCECPTPQSVKCVSCKLCENCTITISGITTTGTRPLGYRYGYKKDEPRSAWTWYPSETGWTTETSHTFTEIEECNSSQNYKVKVVAYNECTTNAFKEKTVNLDGGCCECCKFDFFSGQGTQKAKWFSQGRDKPHVVKVQFQIKDVCPSERIDLKVEVYRKTGPSTWTLCGTDTTSFTNMAPNSGGNITTGNEWQTTTITYSDNPGSHSDWKFKFTITEANNQCPNYSKTHEGGFSN
jgi:PKD repeat protein